ncbi:MAG: xanthine dehydrogenase family protein molybdopterin-binding subunit [Gemmatimonadetes bacterium]|nr:xanthine dehydrogenase family protein molybdopterin-binding subunit [Gemmatimonadota bacterium]
MTPVGAVTRRDFLRTTGAAGSGLVLGVSTWSCGDGIHATAEGEAAATALSPDAFSPNLFVHLYPSGDVEIVVARSEMGQGVRTGLSAVVADEMEADWSRVRVVQAPGDPAFGNQDTDGSRSVRNHFQRLREAGATARRMLEQAAADEWGVPVSECVAREHEVHHGATGQTLAYGDLAEAAGRLPVPEDIDLKSPDEFRYIGRPMAGVDNLDITTGRAGFGIDTRLTGMVYAVVARPPVVGGRVRSYESSSALNVPGVLRVVEIPAAPSPPGFTCLGGVAVVAENTWAAMQGRKALEIDWEYGPNGSHDSASYRVALERAVGVPGRVARSEGDFDAARARAARVHSSEYFVPYLAHAPMEPPACVVSLQEDSCEIWAPVQSPQRAREMAAEIVGLPVEKVTCHVTFLGGAFGRKSKPDFVVEAAYVAREVKAPVQLTWSREDDVRHDFYHAISVQRIEAALDDSGLVTGWLHRTAFPSISATFQAGVVQPTDGELELGCVTVPFDVPNLRCEACEAPSHTRIGWIRSVSNIHHSFAIGCFVDELAALAGRDPKEYLLELIGPPRVIDLWEEESNAYGADKSVYPYDTQRLRRVIEVAAGEAGWGRGLPQGHGLGIAAHYSFVTYVAHVAEVSVADGALRVHRVDCAVDCGLAVNPDRVRAQMEGATVFGLSLALHGEITMRDGRVEQGNFNDYPILRIREVPEIRVHIVESDEPPTGVGEPGVPPVAPAVANAVYAATGDRVRDLPIRLG